VAPVVSLDLDVVIAVDQLPEAERLVSEEFRIERFPHSLNVSTPALTFGYRFKRIRATRRSLPGLLCVTFSVCTCRPRMPRMFSRAKYGRPRSGPPYL
jgi:hypothetical protein